MTTLADLLEFEQTMIAHAEDTIDDAEDEIDNALGNVEAEIAHLRNYLVHLQSAGGTSAGTVEQLSVIRGRLLAIAERATGFAQFSQPRETP